jgi:tetratricopeptide (TPR) repeat protein
MRTFLLSVFLFLVTILLVLPVSGQHIYDMLDDADQLYEQKNYAEAIILYEKCLPTIKWESDEDKEYELLVYRMGMCYYNTDQLDSAEFFFNEDAELSKKLFGESSIDYSTSLNNLGNLYCNLEKYVKAEPYFFQALEITKQSLGELHPNYANSLNNLGFLYSKMGNYEKAEPYYLNAIEIIKQSLGESHPSYASSLSNLGNLYGKMGKYEKAESYYLKALEINKQSFGESHPSYANNLNNLAALYSEMGKYEKAEPYYLKSVEIIKQIFGESHPSYATTLDNLGGLYSDMGNNEKAEPYYLKALEIKKQSFGESHPEYAISLNNIGELYREMGNYEKAEPYYLKALEINKQSFGESHPSYANNLNNLAALYSEMGKYEKAESYYLKALEIKKLTLGESHPDYATGLNNLGELYREMGNYDRAESYYLKTLEIFKQAFGESHPDYASCLNNLGALYCSMGNYDKAEPYYLKAFEIREQVLGELHPDYAASLNNLGDLYIGMGNYNKAEPYFLNALENLKYSLGEFHPSYATILNNLGDFYSDLGNNDKAEPYYLKALEIRKQVFGESHPDYANSLNGLGILYSNLGNYEKAESFLTHASNNLLNQLNSAYSFLSESEQEQFFNTLNSNFAYYNFFAYNRSISNPKISELPLNNVLAIKGASLQAMARMQKVILGSNNSSLISTYQQWTSIREELNKLYNLPLNKRFISIDSLENIANSIEKELLRSSKEFTGNKVATTTTWKDVQNKLSVGEAAIEFVNFKNKVSSLYIALINRKEIEYPEMIGLCTEEDLYKALFLDDISEGRYIRKTIAKEQLKDLYQLIWEPLERSLDGIKTVYLSTSGLLCTIPFQALSPDGKTSLMDQMNIRYLMTTRDAGSENGQEENRQLTLTAALFGGIQYDIEPQQLAMLEASAEGFASRAILPRDGDRSIASFRYLEGTAKEVASIDKTLTASNWKTRVYTGEQATESHFKKLSGENAPAVLHIATHGFYFPLPEKSQKEMMMSMGKENSYRLTDNPLRRTGLALAGANVAWRGDELPAGVEDGILTAYEISNMDLRKTQMVVLSACQTGLGDIKAGEGVFGLQRAFRMAGVKTIIMSLWNVDDTTTAEMMELFFANLSKNETRRNAFDYAMKTIREKYPDQPLKWAAFVMVE